jgi:anaerobic magnesium-protoporphyrin IX monomethyl ester cyclase
MANILLISYDNGSHIPFFPQNLFYLYGALKAAKHTVGIWFQDITHGTGADLTRLLDKAKFDVVAFGFVAGYYQYRTAKQLASAINLSKNRRHMKFVVGGHGPAAAPGFFMETLGCDIVVVGDGEDLGWVDLPGGIYNAKPCENDNAPIGCYNDFPMDIYRLIRWPTSNRTDFCFPVLSSRGCKWHCSFCYRMRPGFHEREVGAIVEELRFLHDHLQINHFQFSDELLMGSERRTEEICESLLKLPFRIKWDSNGRLNYAKLPLLKLMRRSGAEYVNYGIESLNQQLLNEMGKGLTINQIHMGVQATLDAGLSPGINLIWGFPGDSIENLELAAEFIKQYDPCDELRTIRPVCPYPGTPLYDLAIKKGLLKSPEDFYENKHKNSDLITINFMDIPTYLAHESLFRVNKQLVENYYSKRMDKQITSAMKMYLEGDTSFRGYRPV